GTQGSAAYKTTPLRLLSPSSLLRPLSFGSTNSFGDRWRLALCRWWGFLKLLVVGVSNALISSEAIHPTPSQAIPLKMLQVSLVLRCGGGSIRLPIDGLKGIHKWNP
ncbi:unnamed protein product, partial [Musa hybrid cultivar]